MLKDLDTKSKQELIDIIYKLCSDILEEKSKASADHAVINGIRGK